MKKEVRIKEPVRIRTKRLSNGCESIYLDIYMDGRRRYEFLKLYIIVSPGILFRLELPHLQGRF